MIDEHREGRPTAYVLGEMSAEESARFEAELAEDEALRAEVDEIREVAGLLSNEMGKARASLPAGMLARIDAVLAEKARAETGGDKKAARRSWLRRPSVWVAVAAVAAAGPLFTMSASRRPDVATDSFKAAQSEATLMPGVAPQGAAATAPQFVAKKAPYDVEKPSHTGNRHDFIQENRFLRPATDPLSTFSIDVDTASYALIRSYLNQGSSPPSGAVRIEEMINAFSYAYPAPRDGSPFRVSLDLGVAPWAPEHHLVRVGLKGKTVKLSHMDGVNLVFLVDTSGSMSDENKLPLLKKGFRMLVDKLGANDRIAIVAYAGSAGLVLPSTPARDKKTVLAALDRLSSGGSTNGGAGIQLAYGVAAENFLKGGVNRVILATDGDFNVGTTSQVELVELIQEKAKTGVFLSVLGFGMGNFNDSLLEKIADKGNGQYAYIDGEGEAKRVLVDNLGALATIAKDVKIQIEWNPAEVEGYRLIGYENRVMAAQDFNNDKKDAGELGSGHTVTALYEVIPKGQGVPAPSVDSLKYQPPAPSADPWHGKPGEILTVKLRYKEPEGSESRLLTEVLPRREASLGSMSGDFKFSAAVAAFGMLLRGSPHAGNATFDSILALAEASAGDDPHRREFVELVRRAKALRK